MTTKTGNTKVITGKVRFSYCNVWEPRSVDGNSTPKYSVSLIIPKDDKQTINKIQQAIEAAKEEGKSKWGGKIPNGLKTPLRNGDTDRPDDEAYENSYFVNANSTIQPGIVDSGVNPIMNQSEFYSGCYGRASINFYAFNTNGNKGVAAGLQNLQKLEDGEPLGGRTSPDEDFEPLEETEDDILG